MTSQGKAGRGFTLIELLVVIAIIAILAAILFPVFTQAKQAARKAQCCNNLKQLGSAMLLYRDAWSDCLPIHSSSLGDYNGGNYQTYMFGLYNYLKTKTGSFTCPNQYFPKIISSGGRDQYEDEDKHIGKYRCYSHGVAMTAAHNASAGPDDQWYFPLNTTDPMAATAYCALSYPQPMSDINNPDSVYWKVAAGYYGRFTKQTKSVYMWEATLDVCWWNEALMYDRYDPKHGAGLRAPRHNGRTSMLFYDGHVDCPTNEYIANYANVLLGYDTAD